MGLTIVCSLLAAATILIAALACAHGEQKPALFAPAKATCLASNLAETQPVICAEPELLNKADRVRLLYRNLLHAAPFPQPQYVEREYEAWLDNRTQCSGPDIK